MAIAPRGFLVKSPRCTEPPKHGLLSVINPITPGDPHWMASGIEWEDDLCGDDTISFIDVCLPTTGTGTGFEKPADRGLNFCHADPFLVLGSFDCSTVGRPADQAFEIARKRLLAWEERQAERTLWTGVTENGTVTPSFAFGNPDCDILPVDINPAGAVNPVDAIALIEAALGDVVACGGVIHIPAQVAAYLADHKLLREEDGELYSPTGYRYVIGHGYPGTGPANAAAAAGESWIFATGPLVSARSNVIMVPDLVPEAVDRNINNITVRAERFYSIGFSCVLLAIRVELTCACA